MNGPFGRIFGLSTSPCDLLIRINTTLVAGRDGLCWPLDGVLRRGERHPSTPTLPPTQTGLGGKEERDKKCSDATPGWLVCGQAERHSQGIPHPAIRKGLARKEKTCLGNSKLRRSSHSLPGFCNSAPHPAHECLCGSPFMPGRTIRRLKLSVDAFHLNSHQRNLHLCSRSMQDARDNFPPPLLPNLGMPPRLEISAMQRQSDLSTPRLLCVSLLRFRLGGCCSIRVPAITRFSQIRFLIAGLSRLLIVSPPLTRRYRTKAPVLSLANESAYP